MPCQLLDANLSSVPRTTGQPVTLHVQSYQSSLISLKYPTTAFPDIVLPLNSVIFDFTYLFVFPAERSVAPNHFPYRLGLDFLPVGPSCCYVLLLRSSAPLCCSRLVR